MATLKPISTISYNTEAFLKEKLDSWYDAHIIQAYMYIWHKGEDGDKDHIHLRIEPNKTLDPMNLTASLKEYDPSHPTKPLCVRPWRPSKEEDWILYAVHDEDYLKLKYGGGEKGEKLPYRWQDIRASEGFDVEIAYIRAKQMLEHTPANMMKRLENGAMATNLIREGENVFQVNALMRALSAYDYNDIAQERDELSAKLHALEDTLYHEKGIVVQWNEGELILMDAPEPTTGARAGALDQEVF